ncbi:MAG: TadE/TadG family type IV pilus assembly protein [Pseudomonadota bacterium]
MLLRKFTADRSGQVTTVFAFCLIPVCAVAGLSLDLQNQMQREVKTQAVLDSAVLAASKVMQTGASDAEIEETVADFVSLHVDSLPGLSCTTPTVTLPSDDTSIEASLDCTQDTTLMHIVGRETLPVKVESVSTYSLTSIDIAFMFDLSGSMNSNNRLVDLKSATTDALDILLPSAATADVTEHTRVAMASYGNSLNAGPYFKQVTGLEPTRSYSDTVSVEIDDRDISDGLTHYAAIDVYLYDADSGDRIVEFGDGALIKVEPEQLNNMTIVVEPRTSYYRFDEFESFEFILSGTEHKNASESVEPYTLYGDSGMSSLNGEEWSTGKFELELRGFDSNGLTGTKILDKTIEFELFKDGDVRESDESHTITSTCVWERDGAEKFTDAPPAAGSYLSANSAWFRQLNPDSPDGVWEVGFNENGEQQTIGSRCPDAAPVELTNNRTSLDTYVSTLSAGGSTAGHLGVAWTWYLISDRWASVFDGTAAPAAFTDPEIKKAVVLMTDGSFNAIGHQHQGDSQTQARALCDGMKDKSILVYAVAFRAPTAGQRVLRDCATSSTTYFNANSRDELKAAYKDIAVQLSDLRLSE